MVIIGKKHYSALIKRIDSLEDEIKKIKSENKEIKKQNKINNWLSDDRVDEIQPFINKGVK